MRIELLNPEVFELRCQCRLWDVSIMSKETLYAEIAKKDIYFIQHFYRVCPVLFKIFFSKEERPFIETITDWFTKDILWKTTEELILICSISLVELIGLRRALRKHPEAFKFLNALMEACEPLHELLNVISSIPQEWRILEKRTDA